MFKAVPANALARRGEDHVVLDHFRHCILGAPLLVKVAVDVMRQGITTDRFWLFRKPVWDRPTRICGAANPNYLSGTEPLSDRARSGLRVLIDFAGFAQLKRHPSH